MSIVSFNTHGPALALSRSEPSPRGCEGTEQEPTFGEVHGGGGGQNLANEPVMSSRGEVISAARKQRPRFLICRVGRLWGSHGWPWRAQGGADEALKVPAAPERGAGKGRQPPVRPGWTRCPPSVPPEAPECPVFSLLAGRLPDREEDWPRAVQRGVQGHLPAGQEDGGSEEGAGEPATPWAQSLTAGAASLSKPCGRGPAPPPLPSLPSCK